MFRFAVLRPGNPGPFPRRHGMPCREFDAAYRAGLHPRERGPDLPAVLGKEPG